MWRHDQHRDPSKAQGVSGSGGQHNLAEQVEAGGYFRHKVISWGSGLTVEFVQLERRSAA